MQVKFVKIKTEARSQNIHYHILKPISNTGGRLKKNSIIFQEKDYSIILHIPGKRAYFIMG